MSRIDSDTVRHVAALARLSLDDAEIETMGAEMSSILDYFEALEEVYVEPHEGPTDRGLSPVLRSDEESAEPLRHPIESLAPDTREGLIVVPRLEALGAKGGSP